MAFHYDGAYLRGSGDGTPAIRARETAEEAACSRLGNASSRAALRPLLPNADRLLQLLLADLALVMDVGEAHEIAAAAMRYWEQRESSEISLAGEAGWEGGD